MAEEVKMTPVGETEALKPVSAMPKTNPIHKPTVGAAALKPGLKLPQKPGQVPGLKLPTQAALKPGVKLPPKPVIRKPGATVAAAPIPKPIGVDAQGVGKLPTVSATAVARGTGAPAAVATPKPMEALKSVTQKLKGITQEIPQQAILRKTGIIAEEAMSEAQKEAAKHKTARISLADAMGVAPVKNEAAPMKTIRIKRPVNIPAASAAPQTTPAAPAPAAADAPAEASTTVTQRKTLKIARPGGAAVRPGGKFGVKQPAGSPAAVPAADGDVAEIPDIPSMPIAPVPVAAAEESTSFAWTLSALVQLVACGAIGALVWFLWENTQLPTFCGGLGWGA